MNHLGVRYNPSVEEGILDFDGKHALVEHIGELLLGEVLQLVIDEVLNEMVGVFQHAGHDLAVEFVRRKIWWLFCIESVLVVEIRHRVDEALVTLSRVEMTALHSLGALTFLTLVHLVVQGMVHLLFPAVAPGAVGL